MGRVATEAGPPGQSLFSRRGVRRHIASSGNAAGGAQAALARHDGQYCRAGCRMVARALRGLAGPGGSGDKSPEGSRTGSEMTCGKAAPLRIAPYRSEEHTSELQSLMRLSYAVFCLKKKNNQQYDTRHKNRKYKI